MEIHARDLCNMLARLKRNERLLGVDLGKKRIGLALSDVLLTIASPLETLKRGRFQDDLTRFRELIAQHGIGGLVVGLPLHMEGIVGAQAQSARSFAHRLGKTTGLPFVLWDERLSTRAVELVLRDMGASSKRRRELVDKLAATHILQGALDCAQAIGNFRHCPHAFPPIVDI